MPRRRVFNRCLLIFACMHAANFPRMVDRYDAPRMAHFRDPGTRMQY